MIGMQPASASDPIPLVGTFKITAGGCNPATNVISGSYFKLIYPGGNTNTGFFFQNSSSSCFNKSFTMIAPGTQGGLVTETYQPGPRVAFTNSGDARANLIIRPVQFATAALSLSTQPNDPQTKKSVPMPAIVNTGGRLTGTTEAVSAAWRGTSFNQGSPKPGGRRPGLTRPVSGRYNTRTHAFVITWTSKIVGGPFTGFIGYWHLVGRFVDSN
jgi:hypothetical protein